MLISLEVKDSDWNLMELLDEEYELVLFVIGVSMIWRNLYLGLDGFCGLVRFAVCSQIMGRTEQHELTAAQILYLCVQCADIFFLKADICQLGMDHRKVNVLAREYCDDIKRKNKPIFLSHRSILTPFLTNEFLFCCKLEKMSKSDPSSSISMEDDEMKKAYCPPKIAEGTRCLEYIKYLVLPWFNEFTVERSADNNGGNKTFKSFEELTTDYESGELHPGDLKPALAKALNKILELDLFLISYKEKGKEKNCKKPNEKNKKKKITVKKKNYKEKEKEKIFF
ncbi:hypothetical protein UlMin_023735 [Ulmus minor]